MLNSARRPVRNSHRLLSAALGALAGLWLATFAGPALAADEAPAGRELKFADVEVGQRVKVTRTSGASFVGSVVSRSKDAIMLDFSSEHDGLNASIDFPEKYIAKIELLNPLNEAQARAVREQRQIEAEHALEAAGAKAASASATTPPVGITAGKETKTDKTERPRLTEAQVVLLRAFPPEQWGAPRLAEIRRRWIVQGLAPNDVESNFVKYYAQWEDAVRQLESVRKWEADNRDVILLETFPPGEGWSIAKHDALKTRKDAGGELTDREADFLQVYDDWLKAVQATQKDKEPVKPVEVPAIPAEPKEPAKTQEAPAEKPAEPAAEKAIEKPADKPAEETTKPAEGATTKPAEPKVGAKAPAPEPVPMPAPVPAPTE